MIDCRDRSSHRTESGGEIGEREFISIGNMSTGRLKQHLSWLFRGLASGGITSTSGPCSPSCPQVLPTPLAQRFCRSASADAPLPGSSGAASKLGQTLVRDQLPRLPVCPGRLLMHHAASRMAVPAPAVGPCLDRWASLALSRGCQSSSIPRRAPRQHATAADLALYWVRLGAHSNLYLNPSTLFITC